MGPDANLTVAGRLIVGETDPPDQYNFCKNSSSESSAKLELGCVKLPIDVQRLIWTTNNRKHLKHIFLRQQSRA